MMMQRTPALLLACLAAALLVLACSSQAAAARPGRHLTQAIASASSVARPGETVSSSSNAISENGELTVSKVAAEGAGPGTTVNCEQEARNGQIKSKECGGAAGTTSSGSPQWDKAPACKKAFKEYKVEYGTVDKKPWGYEDGRSCALRAADGKATGP